MIEWLTQKFGKNKTSKIQSFTYYIPCPPGRAEGYREKQFDKVFSNFINQGYRILSTHTVSHNSQQQSGMWFVCICEVPQHLERSLTQLETEVPLVEGLYKLENE